MPAQIRESDWKVFKQILPVALDRYCDRVLREVTALTSDATKTPHERFCEICELVRERDRTLQNGLTYLRRSTALFQLGIFYSNGLLTEEEVARFSPEAREAFKWHDRI
jgi:hypothetical protein